jgi:circadian clock protein KaiC
MDRVKTGIRGFDELVDGGFPKGFNVLLTGLPGTGKSIFGMQYLYNGAMKGEAGVYVSLDMSDNKVREQSRQFGWDTESLEKNKKLSILKIPLDREKLRIFDMIEEEVAKMKATRLVFDSLAAFAINIDQFTVPLAFDDEVTKALGRTKSADGGLTYMGGSEKRITYLALSQISKLGTTNLIITEGSGGDVLTVDGVSDYVCDGLISLKSLAVGDTLSRTLETKKMRCTKIDGGIKSYEIGEKGIML